MKQKVSIIQVDETVLDRVASIFLSRSRIYINTSFKYDTGKKEQTDVWYTLKKARALRSLSVFNIAEY